MMICSVLAFIVGCTFEEPAPVQLEEGEEKGTMKELLSKKYWKAAVNVFMLGPAQQFTGINGVLFFASSIFADAFG